MQNLFLVFKLVVVVSLILSACQPTSSPTQVAQQNEIQDIRVQMVEPTRTTTNIEQFPLPNCGGNEKLSQTLGSVDSISKNVTVGGKASILGGGEAGVSQTAKLKLEVQVELAYQKAYESANSRLDSIEMSAAPGSHIVYAIVWEKQTFSSIVRYSSDGKVYEVPYTYELRVPKIDKSYPVDCPGVIKNAPQQKDSPGPEPTFTYTPSFIPSLPAAIIEPYCAMFNQSPQYVQINQPVILWWRWDASSREQVDRHIALASYKIYLDGERIDADRMSDIEYLSDKKYFRVSWYADVGILSPGKHRAERYLSWAHLITDGWRTFGPGGEIETEAHSCEIIVQ